VSLVQANGVTLHVQELVPQGPGTPPTAVLLHGLAADTMASWFFTLAYPLVEHGFRVVLQDLRGHGRSERPTSGYALDDFVDDLDALIGLGGEGPVHLFGNSFGGTIAFAYAARHPARVAGIVAVESSPPTEEWLVRLRDRMHRRPRILATGAPRSGVTRLADTTLREDLPASRLPDRAALAAIRCPVLCLYGEQSPAYELAAPTRRLLPTARIEVFAGQRHSLLVDQPAEVRAVVTAWLDTEFPRGG
jgi:pimeloyl-ACP methyl ester carboxylesterase